MKIRINNVEGSTSRKGAKQNKVYEINEASNYKGFYEATDSKGNGFTIWNYNGDWSKIGVKRDGQMRMTYTTSFEIINENPEEPTPGNPCVVNYNGKMVNAINFGSVL